VDRQDFLQTLAEACQKTGFHQRAEWKPLRRGWCLGSAEFKAKLLEQMEGKLGEQLVNIKHLLNWQTHKIFEGEKGPLVAAFARWPIERCFQEDKSELGLDHYEHRSWTAWHRHMRLVFLAQLFLLRLQRKFKKMLPR